VRDLLATEPGVVGVREVSVSYIGPGRVTVDARIDVDDDLSGAEVEALVRHLDERLRAASPAIQHADLVPTG
jgi:divalent metal cation (Fe/Co/Zn/Cd) transporter